MKKTIGGVLLMLALLSFGPAAVMKPETKGGCYLFGMGNLVNRLGSEGDYRFGTNDFCITSAHLNFGFGLGVSYYVWKNLFLALESNLNLSGSATMTDPSDEDTVKVDTYQNLSAFLILGYDIVRSQSSAVSLSGGGGINLLLNAESKRYTSELGYIAAIAAPERKVNAAFIAGISGERMFSRHLGVTGMLRFLIVAGADKTRTAFQLLAGLLLRI